MQTGLLYSLILYPIFYVFPAYVANGSPVIFGGGTPLDLNRKIGGRPVFGRNKTIRGLLFGMGSGFVISFLESLVPGYGYMLLVGVALTIGTHIGDLFGSFIKRRIGRKEGSQFAVFDQYLFLIFALLLEYPLGHMPGAYGIIFLLALTGFLHVLSNRLAHKAKIKKVPW